MQDFSDDPENPREEIKYIDSPLSLFSQIYTILQNHTLCLECLGRQFSFLATGTSNTERATSLLLGLTMECHSKLLKDSLYEKNTIFGEDPQKILMILAQNVQFPAADLLLTKWHDSHPDEINFKVDKTKDLEKCMLCNDLLTQSSITNLCNKINSLAQNYHFDNFLMGTYLNSQQADKEDEFRSRYNIRNGESFKANVNRLIGKELLVLWNKPTQYKTPDLNIMVDLRDEGFTKIQLQPGPLYLKSRYKKFVRTIPQTHWHCYKCRGKGYDRFTEEPCSECGGTGDFYSTSIQDMIGDEAQKACQGTQSLFHGAGREDLDVRCLGKGRPFIIEIKSPKLRNIDLNALTMQINSLYTNQIYVSEFEMATKEDVVNLKGDSEFSKKKYHALVELAQPLTKKEFDFKIQGVIGKLSQKPIKQRTPLGAVHRRPDLTREKMIYTIEAKFIDNLHLFFKIETQGGAYIKEFISGDQGRTNPSIADIFEVPMLCVELDVVQVNEYE